MKKKLLVLLSSVVAGVGLVGATFAAWAVTDEADPLDVGISPGTVQTGDNDNATMLLQWGEKSVASIEELKVNVPQYRSVQVISQSTGTIHGGKLSITLTDTTPSDVKAAKPEGSINLIDVIQVNVYETKTPGTPDVYSDAVAALALNGATPKLTANQQFTEVAANYSQTFYFEFLIPSTVTNAQYDTIGQDQINFRIEWDKPDSVVIDAYTVYYVGGETAPYIYAYDDQGTPVAGWPGEVMNAEGNGLYSYVLGKNYTNVIFSNNGAAQTANLVFDHDEPYYNGGSWYATQYFNGEFWVENVPQYYFVGDANSWNPTEDDLLTNPVAGVYTIEKEVLAEDFDNNENHDEWEFKIKDAANNIWYSYTSTEGGAVNCTYNTAGDTIRISFSPSKSLSDGHNYITAAKVS